MSTKQDPGRAFQELPTLDLPELYQCVHCGLCLNQCPTYRVLRLEPESPRGRIHLVKAAADGRIELSERFKDHLYLCLLCRACETACPSGVQYGRIAETAREIIGPPGSPKLARTVPKLRLYPTSPLSPAPYTCLARCSTLCSEAGLQRAIRTLATRAVAENGVDVTANLPNVSLSRMAEHFTCHR